jgi:hypothetical protein
MQGVLGLAVELWTFESPGGLQILTFSKCWASPPHLAKVGLRQDTTKGVEVKSIVDDISTRETIEGVEAGS